MTGGEEDSAKATQQPARSASANASSGKLARNVLMSYIATGISMATSFLVTPMLMRSLGAEQYGLWTLMISTIAYTGLIELGLGTAVAKRVAECLATEDRARLEKALGTALALYLGFALLVLLLTSALVAGVGKVFHLTGDNLHLARQCLLVLGFNQGLSLLCTVQSATLFGAGRFDLMATLGMGVNVLAGIVNCVLALNGASIVALTCVALGSTLVVGGIGRRLIAVKIPGIRISLRAADREMARELVRFGARNAVVAVCGAVSYGSDTVIIGLLLPVANVTHYTIASKLISFVYALATKPIDVLMPAYSHFHAMGEKERQFRMFTESVTLTLGLALPFALAICAFSDRIIRAWVGEGHSVSVPILVALALGLLLQLPGHASYAITTGTERNLFLVRVVVVGAVSNVVLSLLFTLRFGPVGVALGSLVTVAIEDFFALPWYVCRQFGFSYRHYIARSLTPLALPASAALGVALALKTLKLPIQTGWTLLSVLSVLGVFWALLFTVGLGIERRNAYVQRIRAVRAR